MALTIDRVGNPTVFGDKRVVFADVTFDSSYPTGGEDISSVLSGIDFLIAQPASGYLFEYDATNKKLLAYNATAAHSHTENTAAAYDQNATTSDNTVSAGSEVASTTDLSSVTTRVFAVGR